MNSVGKREKNQSVIDFDKRNEEYMKAVQAHMKKHGSPSNGQDEWDVLESQLVCLENDLSKSLTNLQSDDREMALVVDDLKVAREKRYLLKFLIDLTKLYERPNARELKMEYEELNSIISEVGKRFDSAGKRVSNNRKDDRSGSRLLEDEADVQKDRSEKRKKNSKDGAAPPKKHKDAEADAEEADADQEANADQESDVQVDRSVKRKKPVKRKSPKKLKEADAYQESDANQEVDVHEDRSEKRKKNSKVGVARAKKRKDADADQEKESDDEEDDEESPLFTITVRRDDDTCGLDLAGTSFQANVILYHPPAKAWVIRHVETGAHFFVNKGFFKRGIAVPKDERDLAKQRAMKYKLQPGAHETGKGGKRKPVRGWKEGHLL